MTKIEKAKTLKDLAPFLVQSRQELLTRFQERKWFKGTDFSVQKNILLLDSSFDAFLEDLAMRPDIIGNLTVLKLKKLVTGNYHALCVFGTRSLVNNELIDYEYVATKHGKNPGFKGLLFIEVDGDIKYFMIKKATRFPLGYQTYDSIGGFVQFKGGQLVNLPKKIEDEIKRQLGIESLVVKRFIDLGQMYTDTSMTNNHISLFAAIINGDNVQKIVDLKNKTLKTKSMNFEVEIEPIERLNEFIHKIDDSYFHTCINRLQSIKVLDLK